MCCIIYKSVLYIGSVYISVFYLFMFNTYPVCLDLTSLQTYVGQMHTDMENGVDHQFVGGDNGIYVF